MDACRQRVCISGFLEAFVDRYLSELGSWLRIPEDGRASGGAAPAPMSGPDSRGAGSDRGGLVTRSERRHRVIATEFRSDVGPGDVYSTPEISEGGGSFVVCRLRISVQRTRQGVFQVVPRTAPCSPEVKQFKRGSGPRNWNTIRMCRASPRRSLCLFGRQMCITDYYDRPSSHSIRLCISASFNGRV